MSLPRLIVLACLGTVAALAIGAAPAPAQPAQTPRNDLPQPYRTVRTWGQLPPGVRWAAVTAIEPAPDGTLYVVHRCVNNSCEGRTEPPILAFDKTGRLRRAFGAGLFNFPHGGTIDRDGNLWMTDARGGNGIGHQAIKLSPEGKVLMTLGTRGVSGSGPAHFDQPTDVVEAPNGDLFVTDSHRDGKNNRVVHFRKDGTYVREWGRKGTGPGEFSEPHTIAMDSQGRLFVGDRENNRIQIFDQRGRFLEEWRQFGRPSGITITNDDTIYVADSESGGRDTGAHELPGIRKGIRIGSAKTGAGRCSSATNRSARARRACCNGGDLDLHDEGRCGRRSGHRQSQQNQAAERSAVGADRHGAVRGGVGLRTGGVAVIRDTFRSTSRRTRRQRE